MSEISSQGRDKDEIAEVEFVKDYYKATSAFFEANFDVNRDLDWVAVGRDSKIILAFGVDEQLPTVKEHYQWEELADEPIVLIGRPVFIEERASASDLDFSLTA